MPRATGNEDEPAPVLDAKDLQEQVKEEDTGDGLLFVAGAHGGCKDWKSPTALHCSGRQSACAQVWALVSWLRQLKKWRESNYLQIGCVRVCLRLVLCCLWLHSHSSQLLFSHR